MAHARFSWTFNDIKALFAEAWDEWNKDEATRLGASLAYYTMLSLAPLLVIVIAVAGFALGREATEGQLFYQIRGLLGDAGAEAIQGMVRGASNTKGGVIATVLGFLALMFAATSVVGELRSAMNKVWNIPQRDTSWKDLFKERSYAVGVVMAAGFLLLVSLVVSAGIAAAGTLVGGYLPIPAPVMQLLNQLFGLAVITGVFALIFKFLPDVSPTWRDVVIGAAITAVLFTIGKYLIGMYLGKAGFSSTFGVAGSLVIVLVWVYYSAQIFFFGAEVTQVYARRHGSDPAKQLREAGEAQSQPKPEPERAPRYQPSWTRMSTHAATGNTGMPPFMDATVPRLENDSTPVRLGTIVGSMAGIGIAIANAFRRR